MFIAIDKNYYCFCNIIFPCLQCYKLCFQMSIKAIFEVILHLHSFTNIQIPHQGIFAIRVQLYHIVNGEKIYAIPYKIIDSVQKPSQQVKGSQDINDIYYRSRVGCVKYSDEIIFFNDIVQFKMQIDAFPQLSDKQVYLEFGLLFSHRYYADQQDIINFQAAEVQKCRIKVQSLQSGIFHFCQGQFQETYLSSFAFTVFAMLIDYKFSSYHSKKVQPTQKELQRQKIQDLEQFAGWLQKAYSCEDPIEYLYDHYVKSLCSNSYNFKGTVNKSLRFKKDIKLKVSKLFMDDNEVDEKIFYQYLTKFEAKGLTYQNLKSDLTELHAQNFFFVQSIQEDFAKNRIMMSPMRQSFNNFLREKYGQRLFKSVSYGVPKNTKKDLQQLCSAIRKKNIIITEYPLLDYNCFIKEENQLIGCYEITYPEKSNKEKQVKQQMKSTQESEKKQPSQMEEKLLIKEQQVKQIEKKQQVKIIPIINLPQFIYDQRKMLIVLCHGFQGSSYDMMMIQRGLKQAMPMANFLNTLSNQLDTERDMKQMGEKLALQVLAFIHRNFDEEEDDFILNFVGHSMGGVIARASLKHLAKYEKNFGFFCSFGSPHIGYLNGVDTMIQTGLWFLNKWNKIKSLEQLSMMDASQYKESFMYKLSSEGSLKHFRKVILFSSMEDSFAPWHSARIMPHRSQTKQTKLEQQMVNNILGDCPIHRIDLNFGCKKNDIQGFIGRTAHINLIIQDHIFKLINWTIPELFDLRKP